ncbi:Trichothecene 3-O-acetyltransferase [Trichoderma lentiforme]|uniref:Trichothecene 3-O-acetyltransferase n=1 Tax=Trichoderma lentiforme TaxID=1567552 RepID=A0A9P4XIN9_9HYPO|nr:Trichothecene 3-O-acetyltransferase [Trichoderma lentiforme]
MPDGVAQSTIVSALESGLRRLTASFPWVAGQVVVEGNCAGNSGVFKIKELQEIPYLAVKDLRMDTSAPTMMELKEANFPMRMLNESAIAPRSTFPAADAVNGPDHGSPVFLLQANFIVGGLVLTFLGQHQTMDIMGQGQIMHLLSKACHDETFTEDELFSGNLQRQNLIPVLDNYERGPELDRHLAATATGPSRNGLDNDETQPTQILWASFTFHPISLAALKSIAVKTLPSGSSYISTDDALSAFIWQSIMRARADRLPPNRDTTFARAIDVRSYVDVPATYTGIVQNMTYTTYTLQELVALPLGEIASRLRAALEPNTTILPFHTRALATYLHSQADKSHVSPASSLDFSVDVIVSSWTKTNSYDLDFNLGLGQPEAVRRPWFTPLQSFVYFMPRKGDGEISVAVCLERGDMSRLKADKQFTMYARYDG